jgi:hypothetical protein
LRPRSISKAREIPRFLASASGRLGAHPLRAERRRLRECAFRGGPPRVALAAGLGERPDHCPHRSADPRRVLLLGSGHAGRDRHATRGPRRANVARRDAAGRPRARRRGARRSAESRQRPVVRDALAARAPPLGGGRRGDAHSVRQARTDALHVGLRVLPEGAAPGRLGREGGRAAAAASSGKRPGEARARRAQHLRREPVPGTQRDRRTARQRPRRRGRAPRSPLRFVGPGTGCGRRRVGCRGPARRRADPEVASGPAPADDPLRLLLWRGGGVPGLSRLRGRPRKGARPAQDGPDHGRGRPGPARLRDPGTLGPRGGREGAARPPRSARRFRRVARGQLQPGPCAVRRGRCARLHVVGRTRRVRHAPPHDHGHLRQGGPALARRRHCRDGDGGVVLRGRRGTGRPASFRGRGGGADEEDGRRIHPSHGLRRPAARASRRARSIRGSASPSGRPLPRCSGRTSPGWPAAERGWTWAC